MNNIFKQNIVQAIAESVSIEGELLKDCYKENILEGVLDEPIEHMFNFIQECNVGMDYTEEMVTIFQEQTAYGDIFLIEHDVLLKYMESHKAYTVKESVAKICEANQIPFEDTYVVIESQEVIEENIEAVKEACKKEKDPHCKNEMVKGLKKSVEHLSKLKKEGIKVMKKKSKAWSSQNKKKK